jgi:hypothetical protein
MNDFSSYQNQWQPIMLNRSALFRSAWHAARRIAVAQSTSLRVAFAEALRSAWASLKAVAATAAAMKAETKAIIAELAAARGARVAHRYAPWQYANAHPGGGM